MDSWRDSVLREFAPQAARLTLVSDPDELLLEEGILRGIKERGYELISYGDPITFRYIYETRFRSLWDQGQPTEGNLVIRCEDPAWVGVPHDIVFSSRKLHVSLAELFPGLSASVLTELEVADLEAVQRALATSAPGVLGENATKEFIFQHVFGVASGLIRDPVDLMQVLLNRHYRGQRVPAALDHYLLQVLRRNLAFDAWPLETLMRDREAFFRFLQERWPGFLDRMAVREGRTISDERQSYPISVPGPTDIPFDQHGIRVFVDNLFLEGLLHAVPHECADAFSGKWVQVGIRSASRSDRLRRRADLVEKLALEVPPGEARHLEWTRFALRWAELIALMMEKGEGTSTDGEAFETLRGAVDNRFYEWMVRYYATLASLPATPPVMLHHVGRHLARLLREGESDKVALVVVDGLSLDQWSVVQEEIAPRTADVVFREGAVFSWVPTITSVSRQALFSAQSPFFFPGSIQSTAREPQLWRQFWSDQHLSAQEVAYSKGLGDGRPDAVLKMLDDQQARVAGLVVDSVDRIMHGMQLGTEGMHNQVRLWSRRGFLLELFEGLVRAGFLVFLTSDHGNIEATGCGRPAEGAVADLRGARARVYPNPLLRSRVKSSYPEAIEWTPVGLPDGYLPLLAPDRLAFALEGERVIAHGGSCIEEVIVPLVRIEARADV